MTKTVTYARIRTADGTVKTLPVVKTYDTGSALCRQPSGHLTVHKAREIIEAYEVIEKI